MAAAHRCLCWCRKAAPQVNFTPFIGRTNSFQVAQKRQFHFSRWKPNRFSENPYNPEIANYEGHRGKVLKPFLFTCVVGVTSFTGAAVLQYEYLRYSLQQKYGGWQPGAYVGKGGPFREKINKWWNRLTDGHKVVAGIIGLNVAVFLCWRLLPCRNFLTTWFITHPASGRRLPMLLSCFSHAELWHLGCNMIVLWSFAPVIVDILGVEQFLAFYTTGGVIASLASHFYKAILRTPSFSLGASGAILAVLAAVCVERPEARLSIIFLPFFSFSASTALLGIIAVDFTGLVLRWQLFDHAAHLGGALFGIWYSKYGKENIWQRREGLIRWWHNFRKGKD